MPAVELPASDHPDDVVDLEVVDSLNDKIHAGAWPSFSVRHGGAQTLGPEVNTAASMACAEGQTATTHQLLLRGGEFARTEA